MTAGGFFAAAPDAALAALFVPFDTGELTLPADGRVLFLRARAGVHLREMARPGWLCEQGFLPFADLVRDSEQVGPDASTSTWRAALTGHGAQLLGGQYPPGTELDPVRIEGAPR